MTLNEFNNLEKQINEAKDCVIVYKNGKPAVVKIIDLPVIHNGTEMTIGEVFEDYKRQIKAFTDDVNSLKLNITKLYNISVKLIEFVQKSNVVNAVQIADIKEEIK
jgi:hypothetical protein